MCHTYKNLCATLISVPYFLYGAVEYTNSVPHISVPHLSICGTLIKSVCHSSLCHTHKSLCHTYKSLYRTWRCPTLSDVVYVYLCGTHFDICSATVWCTLMIWRSYMCRVLDMFVLHTFFVWHTFWFLLSTTFQQKSTLSSSMAHLSSVVLFCRAMWQV